MVAYKAKVALAALKGDKMLAELSEKYEVHVSQIVQWKTQLLDGALGVFPTACRWEVPAKRLLSRESCCAYRGARWIAA